MEIDYGPQLDRINLGPGSCRAEPVVGSVDDGYQYPEADIQAGKVGKGIEANEKSLTFLTTG